MDCWPMESEDHTPPLFVWTPVRKLGEGQHTQVHLVNLEHQGRVDLAAAKFFVRHKGKDITSLYQRELTLLRHVQETGLSYHVIELIGSATTAKWEHILFLELARGGDLHSHIHNANTWGLPEDLVQFYFGQILEGVRFIHHYGVSHLNLNAKNILIGRKGYLKLTDFSLSTGKPLTPARKIGTKGYRSPELNKQNKPLVDTKAIDIWALGVVLWEMLTQTLPWSEALRKDPAYQRLICDNDWRSYPAIRVSGTLRDLFERLWQPNPAKRVKAEDVAESPWCLTSNLLYLLHTHDLMMAHQLEVFQPPPGCYATLDGFMWAGRAQIGAVSDYSFQSEHTHFFLPEPAQEVFNKVLACLEWNEGQVLAQIFPESIRFRKEAGQHVLKGSLTFKRFILPPMARRQKWFTQVEMLQETGSQLHWRALWWTILTGLASA